MFQQDDFDNFVLDNQVLGFHETPIKLVSGRLSHWYVNWRRVSNDVYLADQLAKFVLEFVGDLCASGKIPAPECFYGVPEGATKAGVLAQYLWAKRSSSYAPGSHRLSMGRGQPKGHGAPEDKYFVGSPAGKTIVLEDTTTTGGSVLTTLEKLKELGTNVVAVIGFTNRMERRADGKTVAQAIADYDMNGTSVPYFSLTSADRLLPKAFERFKPSAEVRAKVEEELLDTQATRPE